MEIKTAKEIILKSFLVNLLCNEWEFIEHDELLHLSNFIENYEVVPDRLIADNEEIQKIINWSKISKLKMIRLIARNKNIIKNVNLNKFTYTPQEVKHLIKIHPSLIDNFKINLENLKKDDAYEFLTMGHKEFLSKIKIEKYKFTFIENFEIIKSYEFERDVMEKVDLKILKDYQVADILIATGDKNLDILNYKKITPIKWLEVLAKKPELLKYCEIDKFKTIDIYYSTILIDVLKKNDFSYLITDRDYYNELSEFGWERLIISNPDKWLPICNLKKLNDRNWKTINRIHKHIEKPNQ